MPRLEREIQGLDGALAQRCRRAVDLAAYIGADETTPTQLGDDPSLRRPAAEPELEDFLEFVLKAKRAADDGDELGLRWFAQAAVRFSASARPTWTPSRT